MHSFGYRANALLTFSLTILAFMCAIASLSDSLNSPSPSAQVQVLNINWFQKQPNANDEVSMTLNISADLQSLFTWNTKQVFVFLAAEYDTPKNSLNQISLWDGIIPSKEHAKFLIHTSNKYRFIDQGTNLRGKEFNLTLHWHVMPKTGKMLADKIVMPACLFPTSLNPEILEGLLASVGGVMAFLTLHEMLPLAFEYAGQKQSVKAVFCGMAFMSASLYFLRISLPEEMYSTFPLQAVLYL